MTDNNRKIKFKRAINAAPLEVYMAFTQADAFCEWLCNVAQADAHMGGRVYLWWNNGYYASGEYTDLQPGERLAFSWHGRNEPGITQVKVTLKALDEGGTRLTLVHEHPDGGKVWRQARREYKRGWKRSLENLQSVLETGMDLRFVRRPMLGIDGGEDVDAAKAIELGLPRRSGILISSVVEGLGAANAGLQKGDLLVKLGGKKITGYMALIDALQAYQAEDEVNVVVYRQNEKISLPVTLSARPLPDMPDTVESFLITAEKNYQLLNMDLDACLEDASDEQVSYRTAEGDWNVKENLAHLIAVERDHHSWITSLIEGADTSSVFHTNLSTRLNAIMSAYPTAPKLLSELKRSQAETMSMLSALPDELVARKGSFWRLRYTVLDLHDHAREHVDRLCALLKSARSTVEAPAASETAAPPRMEGEAEAAEQDDEALHAREQASEESPESL